MILYNYILYQGMHSSRMCTGHSLTVCCSLLPGGGCLPGLGGVLPAKSGGGFSLPGPGGGGVLPVRSGGGLPARSRGGFSLPGLGGVSLPGPGGGGSPCQVWGGSPCQVQGGMASQHALRQTPSPPVDRHTPVKTLPWPQLRCGR